jgi:hypothetical protein
MILWRHRRVRCGEIVGFHNVIHKAIPALSADPGANACMLQTDQPRGEDRRHGAKLRFGQFAPHNRREPTPPRSSASPHTQPHSGHWRPPEGAEQPADQNPAAPESPTQAVSPPDEGRVSRTPGSARSNLAGSHAAHLSSERPSPQVQKRECAPAAGPLRGAGTPPSSRNCPRLRQKQQARAPRFQKHPTIKGRERTAES